MTRARPPAELMDRPDLPLADTWRALSDLEKVNRWLFGHLPVARSLLPRLAAGPRRQRIVDLGCGSGQGAERLRRSAAGRRREIVVIGIDRKLSHLVFARRRGVKHLPVVASAEAVPLRDDAVDWALSTLLLHHFDACEGRRLLGEMVRVARRGALIVDLRRAWLSRLLIRLALPLLRVGRVAGHDGRVSADAAWSLAEVRRITAGFAVTELRSRFPYRFSLLASSRRP